MYKKSSLIFNMKLFKKNNSTEFEFFFEGLEVVLPATMGGIANFAS